MDLFSVMLGKKLGGGGAAPVLIDKNITENGTYNASSDEADGYKKVVVDVEKGSKFWPFTGSFKINAIYVERVVVPEGYSALLYDVGTESLLRATHLEEIYLPSTITSDGISGAIFKNSTNLKKIVINKPEGSIGGAPWGAPATCEVIWKG